MLIILDRMMDGLMEERAEMVYLCHQTIKNIWSSRSMTRASTQRVSPWWRGPTLLAVVKVKESQPSSHHRRHQNLVAQSYGHTPMPPSAANKAKLKLQAANANDNPRRPSNSPAESFQPTADTQTYRDLLIFEERLKQNAARLVKRKKKYQSESSGIKRAGESH
jgi:hypothetical protein